MLWKHGSLLGALPCPTHSLAAKDGIRSVNASASHTKKDRERTSSVACLSMQDHGHQVTYWPFHFATHGVSKCDSAFEFGKHVVAGRWSSVARPVVR